MMKKKFGSAIALIAMAVVSIGLLAACGSSSSSSSSGSSTTESTGTESSSSESTSTASDETASGAKRATIFDKELEGFSTEDLPAMTIPVGGGQSIEFAAGEAPKIAYVGYGLGFDYTVPQYKAAEETAAQYGVELDTFDPGGEGAKQVQQLQDILSSGKYNTVVVYPDTPDLTCKLLSKQLPEKNILVVAHNQPVCTGADSTPGVLTTIWDPNTEKGEELWAEKIVESVGTEAESAHAIILTGPEGDTSSEEVVAALEKVFDPAGITIDAVERTDYTTPDAQQKIQDALQAHQDTTMVVSTFGEGTRGTVSALKVAGKSGDIEVYDFGGAASTIKDIEEGTVTGSSPEFPYSLARSSVQAALAARIGKKVPPVIYNSGVAGVKPDEIIWVDKSDVSGFEPEF